MLQHHSAQELLMTVSKSTVLAQGAIAGLIGYATLAITMTALDLISGLSPFHTAAVLGATLFYGVSDTTGLAILPDYVLAYNGAHLLAFLAFGVIAAALATVADRGRQLWYVSAFFYVFVAFHSIGAVQALSAETRASLSASAIWVGGIVASAAMAVYVVRAHPRMRRPQSWTD